MPVVELRERIDAPVEVVWGLCSDIVRAPEWVTVMRELVETTENPVVEGTTYTELSKVGPKEGETTWHVTAFEPLERQVHETAGTEMEATLTMAVEEDGDGTRLLHRTAYRMFPGFRPLGWLVERLFARRTMARELAASVANLRRLAEEEARERGAVDAGQA